MALNKVGAGWAKKSKDNTKFLSVELINPFGENVSLLIFPNDKKEKDGQPDYQVYKPSGEGGGAEEASAPEEI